MFRIFLGSLFSTVVFWSAFCFAGAGLVETDPLKGMILPKIVGDTLHIAGRIDDHIYNYIAYEYKAMENVKFVSLNSYGGNHEWSLLIAEKIKERGLQTQVREGNVCASACIYLFGAGASRIAHTSTWFGIHGARLGASALTSFIGLCFIDIEEGRQFMPTLKGCQEIVTENTEQSSKATHEAFDFLEDNGISGELRATYLAKDDDPAWPASNNFFRKPDWILPAEDAKGFHLVTEIYHNSQRFRPAMVFRNH